MLPPPAREYLITALDNTPATVRALLAGLPPSEARWQTRLGPDRFSVIEIVDHLADWDNVFGERFDRTLLEEKPHLDRPDPDKRSAEKSYGAQDPSASVERFMASRSAFTARLRTLPAAAWERFAYMDRIGDLTLDSLLALMLAHDTSHIRQLSESLHRLEAD